MLLRSPVTTPSAPGTPTIASLPRCSVRACRTTLCPCSTRSRAAIFPNPSADPVMKTRAMIHPSLIKDKSQTCTYTSTVKPELGCLHINYFFAVRIGWWNRAAFASGVRPITGEVLPSDQETFAQGPSPTTFPAYHASFRLSLGAPTFPHCIELTTAPLPLPTLVGAFLQIAVRLNGRRISSRNPDRPTQTLCSKAFLDRGGKRDPRRRLALGPRPCSRSRGFLSDGIHRGGILCHRLRVRACGVVRIARIYRSFLLLRRSPPLPVPISAGGNSWCHRFLSGDRRPYRARRGQPQEAATTQPYNPCSDHRGGGAPAR